MKGELAGMAARSSIVCLVVQYSICRCGTLHSKAGMNEEKEGELKVGFSFEFGRLWPHSKPILSID